MPRDTLTLHEYRSELELTGRGGTEVVVPALLTPSNEVAIIDREYKGDLISAFGLVERTGEFPDSFTEIDAIAAEYPDKHFEIYELHEASGPGDGHYVGLSTEVLHKTVRTLGGQGGFDPDDYTLYRPTGVADGSPFFMLEASDTPEAFITQCLFGGEEAFLREFGAAACRECEAVFDFQFVECPQCGTRPEEVDHNVELIQEEHDGVLAFIAPRVIDGDLAQSIREGDIPARQPLDTVEE